MSASSEDSSKQWMSPRAVLRSILMLDDTPHSIALGTAIGMFVGMTPTVGVQMIIVLIISFLMRPLFRFNRVAGMLTVYVTNPVTIVPIYWFNYKVGTLFVAGTVTYDDFNRIVHYEGFAEWWVTVETLFASVGAPLLVGCLIVGGTLGCLTYPAMFWLVKRFHDGDQATDSAADHQEPMTTEPADRPEPATAQEPAGH